MFRAMCQDPAGHAMEWIVSALVVAIVLIAAWSMFKADDDDDLYNGWGRK